MNNLPSRDIELLMTYERLARALEAIHLNHEQRAERIALIGRMVEAPMNWATSDFLKWLYPLYHLLLTLYASNGSSSPLTHTEIKHGLRFFAEVCQEARKDLETIAQNRHPWSRSIAYYEPDFAPSDDAPPLTTEEDNHVNQWVTVELHSPFDIAKSFTDLPDWLQKTDDEGDSEDTNKVQIIDDPSVQ